MSFTLNLASIVSNASSVMTGGYTPDEGHVAVSAGSTACVGALTDPVYAGVTGLAAACLFKEMRTPSHFAGVGGAALLGLAFGPIGGLAATATCLLANRIFTGLTADESAKALAAALAEVENLKAQAAASK